MTHLTPRRVSELLDGQLSAPDTEASWGHVHTCHLCRDEVEREGWVKTRLSSLSVDGAPGGCTPDRLKGALLGMPPVECFSAGVQDDLTNRSRPRRHVGSMAGIAALGGGAAGAAVMGLLALGPSPAELPTNDRRPQPVSQFNPGPVPPRVPVRVPIRLDR